MHDYEEHAQVRMGERERERKREREGGGERWRKKETKHSTSLTQRERESGRGGEGWRKKETKHSTSLTHTRISDLHQVDFHHHFRAVERRNRRSSNREFDQVRGAVPGRHRLVGEAVPRE